MKSILFEAVQHYVQNEENTPKLKGNSGEVTVPQTVYGMYGYASINSCERT